MSQCRGIEDTPMDSGYSWIILIAASSIYLILGGYTKSYGVLYTEFLLYYGTGSGNTAWIGSVNILLFFAMGPLANRLAEWFTFRRVIMLGAVLNGIGMFASAFMPQMEFLYITYGLVTGIGGGLVFSPTNTILSFYFEKRRGLANSIMISAGGLGSFLFPYLYRFLIDMYGIQGALMVIGGLLTHICIFAMLLQQPSQILKKFKKPDTVDIENTNTNAQGNVEKDYEIDREATTDQLLKSKEARAEMEMSNHIEEQKNGPSFSISNLFDFSLFRNPRFAMYVMAYTANTCVYVGIYTALPPHIIALGHGKENVVIALSITGAMEIFSKLLFGWIADTKIISVKNLLLITFVVTAIASIAIPFFKDFIALAVYAGIVGVFPGSYFTVMAVALLQCIPLTDLISGFGLTCLCLSFGAALCQPLAGWIEDATGTWDASFWFIGGMACLATVILLLEPVFIKHWFLIRVQPTKDVNKQVRK